MGLIRIFSYWMSSAGILGSPPSSLCSLCPLSLPPMARRRDVVDIWTESFLDKASVAPVKGLVRLLSSPSAPPQKRFRRVLASVISYLETRDLAPELAAALKEDDALYALFAGLHSLLLAAVRSRVPEKAVRDDLAHMEVPKVFLDDAVAAYSNKRDDLVRAQKEHRTSLPELEDVSWRVDVQVSTTSMARVMRPALLMRVALSDGTIRTFECSVRKFHELRYNLARVLKNSYDLHEHPMLFRDVEK